MFTVCVVYDGRTRVEPAKDVATLHKTLATIEKGFLRLTVTDGAKNVLSVVKKRVDMSARLKRHSAR